MTRGLNECAHLRPQSLLLLFASLAVAATASLAEADTIYVDLDATGVSNGASWTDAYTDLEAALAVAEIGDEIWVAAGTYRPSVPAGRDATFRLIDGVALYGGFAGTESKRGDRNWTAYKSILSGDIGTLDDSSDNCCTVVTGCDHAVLDGFTITRGNANIELDGNNFPPTFGGGMANLDTSPTVRNCHFLDNAADSGGGMVNIGGSPAVTDCTFEGNTAVFYGGGMWNLVSTPTVTRCTFSDNWAGEEGGGMSNDTDSDAFVSDCTFSDNAAPLGGGMCSYASSSPTVADCTFSGNFALFGGGMNNYTNSSPAVTGCDFSGNWAWLGGGMSNDTGSNPAVTGCLFDVNVAGWAAERRFSNSIGDDRSHVASRGRAVDAAEVEACSGGGMYNFHNGPAVRDCTFSGNSADNGGGMSNESGSHPTVTDCTFSGNSAWGDGGGMDNYDNSSPTVAGCAFSDNEAVYGGGMSNYVNCSPTVTECTFSGNSAPEGGGMDNYDSSSPRVTDCTFSDNEAAWGGGMDNYDSSSPTVINCTFSDNEAIWGGGMDNYDTCSPTVTDCTFSGNFADEGGGMSNYENCSPTVTHCTFTGNEAAWVSGRGMAYEPGGGSRGSHRTFSKNGGDSRGGGMYNEESTPTVTHCTFTGNRALGVSSAGGAMCNVESSPAVANCTISGNEAAYYGGGMYNVDSSPSAIHCTFFDNVAEHGGGIYNRGSEPTVRNTILARNAPDDCYVYGDGEAVSGGYNLEGGTSCGCTEPTDQQNTDPLLGPLADNGGPTLTHALLPGSPALDVIPWPGAPATDQRGFLRPYPVGGLADIGAVEMQRPYSRGDVNGDGAINLLDVVLCQQIARGWVGGTPQQRAAADVDDDGDVDEDDVTILSEVVLGVRTTLP